MNTTPVLSKKQQQKKMSAKKGLRNVLAQPYEKYWPVLGKDEESGLEELLNRLLSGLKRESNAIPWALLRKMEKAERLAAQKKVRIENQANTNENTNLKAFTMGVNAVTRDLEKDKLSSVLLDSTVESLLVKHLVLMSQNKGIPILLVPFLKKVTLENVGFASAALGLKSCAAESCHPFHEVHQAIVKCSLPLLSVQKALLNESTNMTFKDSEMEEELPLEGENSAPKACFTLSENVYKYRSTRKERFFVPPGTIEKVENDKEWVDFIAIGNDDIEMDVEPVPIPQKKQRYMDIHAEVEKDTVPDCPESDEYITFDSVNNESSQQGSNNLEKSEKTMYLPLKVKRIQGNNNRLKATKVPKQKKKSSSNKG